MRADDAMARAQQAKESSTLLLNAGDFVGSINRAYYAMFYAAHAGLAHSGIEVPSAKHGTLVSRFGEHLVKTGRVAEHFGRWLNQALELRSIGDYGDVPPKSPASQRDPRQSRSPARDHRQPAGGASPQAARTSSLIGPSARPWINWST
jgi:uncharacterized protein (UPF0332 family)